MILHYRKYESAAGATADALLILHGLYGQQGNWATLARQFANTFTVYALDLRNHGQSAHMDSMSLDALAQDVADTMKALGLSSANLLGHSLGGKVAMLLALQQPLLVKRLVVVDIAPVAYAKGDEQVLQGLCALELQSLQSRTAADTALSEYVPAKNVRDFLLANLQKGPDNNFVWRFNLPVIKQFFSQLIDWPSSGRLFTGPALFIKGELSAYILPEYRELLLAQFPAAQLHTIAGAGHWVHSENPAAFHKLVADFLE